MSLDAKKNCKCNQAFHLTSLSARPYRANAALCCSDPFFESKSSSKGLSPPSWTIPAWLCVFCEDYIKSVNIRSPNNPQHILIFNNWVFTAYRQEPSKNDKWNCRSHVNCIYHKKTPSYPPKSAEAIRTWARRPKAKAAISRSWGSVASSILIRGRTAPLWTICTWTHHKDIMLCWWIEDILTLHQNQRTCDQKTPKFSRKNNITSHLQQQIQMRSFTQAHGACKAMHTHNNQYDSSALGYYTTRMVHTNLHPKECQHK